MLSAKESYTNTVFFLDNALDISNYQCVAMIGGGTPALSNAKVSRSGRVQLFMLNVNLTKICVA